MKFAYASGSRPLEGYTIKRGIGVGGFGEVYFATSDAGKEVALKRVQRHSDVEIRGVTQCLNLKHRNLIGLFDIKYSDEGEAWVVMEYVDGESLKDVIDRNPDGMPLEEVNRWFLGIAAGVIHLHDHGIVHRDLKPGNVFIDEDMVKIGDYGLSKFISCSRRSGQTESVGTFHYMAPEIGKGVYGKEIDIYALGVILYEMLTGRVPFDGESSQEIIMKHLTSDPDLSGVRAPYREVIRRALLKDPDQRIGSVRQMIVGLKLEDAAQVRDVVGSAAAVPPVRSEELYITDDPVDEGIEFGPVREVVAAQPVASPPRSPHTREPIAQAIGASGKRFIAWWRNAHFSTPVKVLLVLGAVFVVAVSSEVWVPIAFILAMAYLVYLTIRAILLAVRGPRIPASAPAPHAAAQPPNARSPRCTRRRHNWKEAARAELRRKPRSQRLAELTGSLLMSAVVAAVLCLLMMVLGGDRLDGEVGTWSYFAWLTLICVAGAWGVLTLGKCWEGDEGEQALRRFVMLVFGLTLGAAAFGANELLMIERLSSPEHLGLFRRADMPSGMFASDGTPLLAGYLVFFATLLLILCWWKQADPLRSTRFSLRMIVVSAAWGFLLPFPQPCGVVLATTISAAVQLSAPWMPPQERTRIRNQNQAA